MVPTSRRPPRRSRRSTRPPVDRRPAPGADPSSPGPGPGIHGVHIRATYWMPTQGSTATSSRATSGSRSRSRSRRRASPPLRATRPSPSRAGFPSRCFEPKTNGNGMLTQRPRRTRVGRPARSRGHAHAGRGQFSARIPRPPRPPRARSPSPKPRPSITPSSRRGQRHRRGKQHAGQRQIVTKPPK